MLPKLPRDAGDRNRTSPFAFTGNKFEFRAVGGSFNVAGPNTVLNTIVAESLDYIATELEKATKGGKDLVGAIQELLPKIIKEHKRVVFNGDNYVEEWQIDAEKRGLPNLKSTIECLPVLKDKKTLDLLSKYKVYSGKELESRFNILSEKYVKEIAIEASTMINLAKSMVLPAAMKYQMEVAQAVGATKAAGVDSGQQLGLLKDLTVTIGDFQKAIASLESAAAHHGPGDAFDHAKLTKSKILPAMEDLRKLGDKLETIVSDEYWPLPTYREMLFIK